MLRQSLKNLDHNLTLLGQLDRLLSLDCPILAGLSRKSMIVKILGYEPASRTAASLGEGAGVLRETVEAVRVWFAARQTSQLP